MSSTAIIYPAITMFALTLGVIFSMGIARRNAVVRGEVRMSYFRTYIEGTQPTRLHILSRHVQNHFEVPPLFYVGVIFIFVTGMVSSLTVSLAWLFVIVRCVHTYIHLGSNNVRHRFYAFVTSLLILAGLWVTLFISLIRA